MESVCSRILKHSNIHSYIEYKVCRIKETGLEGRDHIGCVSKDFLEFNEELITFAQIIDRMKEDESLQKFINKTKPANLELNISEFDFTEDEKCLYPETILERVRYIINERVNNSKLNKKYMNNNESLKWT